MKKKIISLVSALVLMLGTFSTATFADETEGAKSANVYVTITDGKGRLVLTQEKVEVTDNNKDGILTIDEALYAAHEAKYEGGAEAGYTSGESQWGLSLLKLWGDDCGSYGYCVNNKSSMELSGEVKEGDYINAYVYTDLTAWSDTYCYFDVNTMETEQNENIVLTLMANGYDANWNPIAAPVENAIITVNGEKTDYRTDKDGKVTITINKEGSYVLSAISDTQVLVPAGCELTVSEAETSSRNETTTPEDKGDNETDTIGEAYNLMDGIVRYKMSQSGATDIQQWIDGELTENAGTTSEWYVLALGQSGEYDFASYVKALKEYLGNNTVSSATSRQKYAIILAMTGSTDSYISRVLEESIGKQGITSLVYGLHLLNNGYAGSTETVETVKDKILSLQLEDGGWSIMGNYGDNDVTAMTLQALAPYYNIDEAVTAAVDRALELLSSRQLEDGDYTGYGVANPESTAQVITALSSLGIDGEKDSRFIKNGNTLLDGLRKYQLTDGSFCHTLNGGYSDNATVQALYSLVSYTRMINGKPGLYIFDNCNPDGSGQVVKPPVATGDKTTLSKEETATGSYKPWACLVIAILAGVVSIVLYLTKKHNKKNLIALVVLTGLAICFVLFTDFKSADDYYNGEDVTKENAIGKVTLTIRCDTVAGKTDSKYIPENGIILDMTEFAIDSDDTVYDILTEAARKYSIHMENSGSEGMVYISGINYLYEFDFGELSGWTYYVNDESPSAGCDQYKLKDGDVIEWLYTCELGKDIK